MTRTPAYLDGSVRPLDVVLDGPSLRVEQAGRAATRLPLARLGRLVLRDDVTLEPAALAACLRAGLSLTVLGGRGELLGVCLPAIPRASDIAQLLDEADALPDWPDRLAAWRAAETRRAVIRLLRRLAFAPSDLRPQMVRRRLARFLEERAAPPCPWPGEVILCRLEALLAARVSALLLAEGVGHRFQNARNPGLDLQAVMVELMSWELWPIALHLAAYLRDHGRKHRNDADLQRRLVRRLEARGDELDRLFAGLCGRLRRLLADCVP